MRFGLRGLLAGDARASGFQLSEAKSIVADYPEKSHSRRNADSGPRKRAVRGLVRISSRLCAVVAMLVFAFAFLDGTPARAQVRKPARKRQTNPAKKSEAPANPLVDSKADLIKAATEHKTNLEKELALLDEVIARQTAEVEKKKSLLELGILAKRELESSEQALALANGQRTTRQSEATATDNLIAEATAAEQIARSKPMPMGGYLTTAALIRYIGPTQWVLSDVSKVESFFIGRFGHQLPISAMGQTPVHDRLGFDHHESVDVAIHPDSVEGQTLIAYLRNSGISFIAFRQAVAGSATGAHIHIGLPSHRLIR